jgi:hypothetical protein
MNMKTGVGCIVLAFAAIVISTHANAAEQVAIIYDPGDPQISFAAGDLSVALQSAGYSVDRSATRARIVFTTDPIGLGPQAFRIITSDRGLIQIVGGDSLGAMYGGLEVAEMITLGGGLDAVVEKSRKPYLFRRGLKFNIPFDGRAPSYDDTGTAAQENVAVMWEWEFWETFLDTMARNRYNVLTLWTCHPYPGIVKLPEYPGVGYDDVCVLKETVDMSTDRHFDAYDMYDPAKFKVVKKISLDDKIAFWQKVFDHADARGIDIIIFHWNIYTFGARDKHGITDKPDNQATIDYMRYAIAEFLKTYPQVDGIGLTAGEHVDRQRVKNVGGIEKFLWRTYGQGVMDAKAADPDRDLTIIFRQHQANLGNIVEAFKDFDGPFNTGHKYARARLYSTTTSPYLDVEYRDDLEENKVPCWLNLRNDDIFIYRWADAEYVREFLQNVPRDLMRFEAGFYMGPDGFVWGREFVSKDPELAGEMEVDKHWYRFMLWGRLGYDLTLTRDYFEERINQRFPKTDPTLLYDTWAAASQIVPQVNRFYFRVNDIQFSPESCLDKDGFLTVNMFFDYPPVQGSGIWSVQDYAGAVLAGSIKDRVTPMEVADNLDRMAEKAIDGAKQLRKSAKTDKELAATLTDIEATAYLGKYYADKIRAAADLAVFRSDPTRKENGSKAVQHLANAVKEWEAYANVSTPAYKPQLFSRTGYMDWNEILNDVKKEVETVRAETR